MKSKGKLPTGPNASALSFSINDKLYYGGGVKKEFYEYDVATAVWTPKTDVPNASATGRTNGIAFSIGNKGYIVCGNNGTVLKDLWEYDPATDTWTQKADFPGGGRQDNAAFVIDGKAYVVGGNNTRYWNDLYVYDPATDNWTKKANFIGEPLINPSTFVIDGYGYVVGGATAKPSESAEMYRYDPIQDKWETMPKFPGYERHAGIGFTLDGKGYFGLGEQWGDDVMMDFYAFDPATNSWSSKITSKIPGRAWASVATINNKAYVTAGAYFTMNGLYGYDDIWEFTPSINEVKAISPISEELSLFPNPARATVMVQAPSIKGVAVVTLVDVAGHTILSSSMANATLGGTVNISSIPSGEYFLKVEGNGHLLEKKLVKE